jgi:hypothetical protein
MDGKPIRIAYCVICHKYTPVLEALVEWLGDDNDFYIHVDAKVDIVPFEPLRNIPNVFFVENRINVYWGGYSQIEAYLATIKATCRNRYDYIALVSGDTLPLRSNTDIKHFLCEHGLDTEYIIERRSDMRLAERIMYRYPEIGNRYRTGKPFWRIRFKFHLFRKHKTIFTQFSYGSVWFIITSAFRDYMFEYLERNPWYKEEFAESYCGDEMFFHMLIKNSPFASHTSRLETMYVDWYTGPDKPRTLDESDLERLLSAKCLDDGRHHFLYARKVSDNINLAHYQSEVLKKDSERQHG